MKLSFRSLHPDELDLAYTVVQEAASWLAATGRPNWLIPYEVYRERQLARENYGLFYDHNLAFVVTLCHYKPLGWDDVIPEPEVMWLSTLNSARRFSGRGLGEAMMRQIDAEMLKQRIDALYLDCYAGFLPNYYAAYGFEYLARRKLVFPDGSLHDSVLMRKRFNGVSTKS